MLMIIWNLRPTVDVGSTPAPDGEAATPGERSLRACSSQSFPYPLTAVVSHPSSSKEFLVADNHGSIFLIDWRAAVAEEDEASGRKTSLLEFVSPRAVADTLSGKSTPGSGSISWRRDAINMYV